MRYINITELELPASWLDRAIALRQQLEAAKSKEERALILDENPIWQELVVPLSQLSRGKCWYSEANEIMSDKDVDHFRPKNEARGLDKRKFDSSIDSRKREGYWWLAYDWENYRLSSIYCNRRRTDKFRKNSTGGKWSYFPLFKGSHIAETKERLSDEDIVLIDPINEYDVSLITFDSNGDVIPNTKNPQEVLRVKVSEKLYHLDHTPLREERVKIWNKCQRYINEIDRIKANPVISTTARAHLNHISSELKRMTSKDEELSAVAIACCEYNRQNYLTRS